MGFTVVYTWHDVVPIVGVFDDDEAGRREMPRHLDGVITITTPRSAMSARRFGVPPELIDGHPREARRRSATGPIVTSPEHSSGSVPAPW